MPHLTLPPAKQHQIRKDRRRERLAARELDRGEQLDPTLIAEELLALAQETA